MELNIVTTCFLALVLYAVHWFSARSGKNKGILAGIGIVTSCFIRVYYKEEEGEMGFVDLIVGPSPQQHHQLALLLMEQFQGVIEILICHAECKDKVHVLRRWHIEQEVFLPYHTDMPVPNGFNGFWSSPDAPY